MWYVIKDDELYHHGIKGQKWGVRRFQNPDGTLTAQGQRRYDIKEAHQEFRQAAAARRKQSIKSGFKTIPDLGLSVKSRHKMGAELRKFKQATFAKQDAKIKYKIAKAKDGEKDEAERKATAKAIRKADKFDRTSLLVNSNMGADYRRKILAEKGKEYLADVEKRSSKGRIFDLLTGDMSFYAAVSRGKGLVGGGI